jgi:diaminopimelate decarboxylase
MVLAFFSFFPKKKKRKGVQLHRWAMRHGLSWQVHVLLRANPSKVNISTTYKKSKFGIKIKYGPYMHIHQTG